MTLIPPALKTYGDAVSVAYANDKRKGIRLAVAGLAEHGGHEIYQHFVGRIVTDFKKAAADNLRAGALRRALEMYIDLICIDPGDRLSTEQIGRILLVGRNATRALCWLHRAKALAPENIDLRFEISKCYRALGQPASAVSECVTALERIGTSPQYLTEIVAAARDAGAADRFVGLVNKGLKVRNDIAASIARRIAVGNSHEAYNHLRRAMRDGVLDSALLRAAALTGLEMGNIGWTRDILDSSTPGGAQGITVIRESKVGFWGEVLLAAAGIVFAEICKREPFIYWGSEFFYTHADFDNAWDRYFEPINALSRVEVEERAETVFPARWTRQTMFGTLSGVPSAGDRTHWLEFMASDASVLVSDSGYGMDTVRSLIPSTHSFHGLSIEALYRRAFQKIKVQQRYLDLAEREYAVLASGRKVVAVHYRTPSPLKIAESAERKALLPEEYFNQIDEIREEIGPSSVLLLTDFEGALPMFRARYGDDLLVPSRKRVINIVDDNVVNITDQPKSILADEVIVDVLMASMADRFVGYGASGVSVAVYLMRRQPGSTCRLLMENVIFQEYRDLGDLILQGRS